MVTQGVSVCCREGLQVSIKLRALAPEHIPWLLEACSDWEELAQHGSPYWRPRSCAELQRKIDDTAGPLPAAAYTFVIVDETRLVGEVSVHAIDWRNRVAQVGVCIWRPEDRCCGYGMAGCTAVIDWAVKHLGLRRLEAWILKGNSASLELFRTLGFEQEGTFKQRYLHDGYYKDINILVSRV